MKILFVTDMPSSKHLYVDTRVAQWPANVRIPQANLEFEVDDVDAAASELQPEGLIVGVCHTPWLHSSE